MSLAAIAEIESLDAIMRVFSIIGLTIVLPLCVLGDLTGLGVITTKGWVSYTVGGDWKVLSMQTKPPKTAAIFQIPNSADDGTPDSTNVVLMTFETDSSDAASTFNKLVRKLRAEAKQTKYKQWDFYTHEGKQGQTNYALRDASRQVPGAFVIVTFAWPHLAGNPKDYDTRMEAAFRSVLDSVEGGIGPKPKKEGEVYRRPINK